MNRIRLSVVFVSVITGLVLIGAWKTELNFSALDNVPQRIVSLSPSITETLFALGVENHLVAVTDFCDYPPVAETLPSIGGSVNANPERIIQFQPDLVILLSSQHQLQSQLTRLGINTLSVDNSRLETIKHSVIEIGERLQADKQAQLLVKEMDTIVDAVRERVTDLTPIRTMVAIAHYVNSDQLDKVYIAGQQDFYNDLLVLAGGINVYQDQYVRIPYLTKEGIISLNPDVIIDVFPEAADHQSDLSLVQKQWENVGGINAVKHQQIHIIEADYAATPGPRIVNVMLDFAKILHPEIDWTEIQPIQF